MASKLIWPMQSAIRFSTEDETVQAEVTYCGRRIGKVIPTDKTWNEDRDRFWTTSAGGFYYTRNGAAYELATKHVRGELRSK